MLLGSGCSPSPVAPPELQHLVLPGYPKLARDARVHAQVVLEYTIQPNGNVKDVRVVSGSHPLLDRALTDSVRQWKYRSHAGNRPLVRQVTFQFRLEEAERESETTTFDPPDRIEIMARVKLVSPP